VTSGLLVPIGLALSFGLLAACGKRPERIPSGGDASTASRTGVGVRSNPSSTGQDAPSPHGSVDPRNLSSPHGAASDATSPFAWTCPPGWTELPTTTMRLANFRPGGDPHAECYMTLLGGDAGGLGANVNRWRAQLALPALDPAAIDALPKAPFLGRDGVLLEANGTWTGMSGMESSSGWGLTGLLLVEPGGSAFLKMTGPAKLVADEREHFLELAKSFHAAKATDSKPAPGATPSGAPGQIASGAPSRETTPATEAPHGSPPKDDFVWTLPEGWRRGPDKPMRAATFYAGPGETLECYIAVFPGEAGGVLANVNRWRGQLDLPPLSESDVASLASIPMLGRNAVLVEGEGKGAALVGAACPGPDRSVFVKMSGPPELVKTQRAAFLAFCASLEERK
jgi:hypothetical protein